MCRNGHQSGSQVGPLATNHGSPKLPRHPAMAWPLPGAPPLLRRRPRPLLTGPAASALCNERKPSRPLHLPCRTRLLLALPSLTIGTHRPRRFLFRPALAACALGEIACSWIKAMSVSIRSIRNNIAPAHFFDQ
ncbi:hypothetical protein SETIT_5G263900v2 [Setaria italica]|uniref:Uncharacterized protein n=1 Tax=Setaria italica TaxID=4555 RepID=A0A368R900_SETIT|nr:hypothetical protein SETIT_5G263900v2 [Setaria italica]